MKNGLYLILLIKSADLNIYSDFDITHNVLDLWNMNINLVKQVKLNFSLDDNETATLR